ncbi:MAG TPA: TonB-dependent receptor [Gemmatimonadaceae bacterium]|nr:TonB-dependent receptor [Gemmatimonadaceae bacterium]
MSGAPSRIGILGGALAIAIGAPRAAAQRSPADTLPADSARVRLAPIVVRALPTLGTVATAPWAVTVRTRDAADRARPGLALDEAVRAIPGVQVDNRHNYALGERISIRGFGARAQFGVRGVRVLVDGVPATLPDGQSTLNHVDVALVRRVEVLRGAASSLHGNAAGGVLLLETAPPPAEPFAVDASALVGAYGLRRSGATAGGTAGSTGWMLSGSRLTASGYRAHADASNTWVMGRLLHEGEGWGGALVVSGVEYDARNPGSLSDSLLRLDRRQAFRSNVAQNTGEVGRHVQVGGVLRAAPRGVQLEVAPYLVRREIDNPIPGRVIDLARAGGGVRALARSPEGADARAWWAAGAALDLQRDDRQNFANDAGARGALVLDQLERVRTTALFAQVGAAPVARLRVTGGARVDRVHFRASDRLVSATDPDDSGVRTMSAVSPSLGASLRVAAGAVLHANLSSAFETPTTTELANRPTGAGGFNPELSPQRARSAELGVKGALRALDYEAALFQARVHDALIAFEVAGAPGRQYFRNAGRVEHRGAELGVRWRPTASLRAEASYTLVDSRFREYVVGTRDLAGHRVPGVAPHRGELGVTWTSRRGAFVGLDGRAVGRTAADDAGTAHSPGYAVADLRLGAAEWRTAAGDATVQGGVSNLLDARYNASVVVNAFGRRYFEPAPERALWLGLGLRLARRPAGE